MTPTEVAALAERASPGPFHTDGCTRVERWLNMGIEPDTIAECESPFDAEFFVAARTHWPLHAQQLSDLQALLSADSLPVPPVPSFPPDEFAEAYRRWYHGPRADALLAIHGASK